MSELVEFISRVVLIGVGATAVLDLWAIFLKHLFKIPSLNWAMVGRWLGNIPRGRFRHESMADADTVRGELLIGWGAHYLIGIIFATFLLSICGLNWARHPSLLPAFIVGWSTLVAPFFIMQPCMGAGIAASKTPNPTQARLRSLLAHTIFGFGLYAAARISAMLINI